MHKRMNKENQSTTKSYILGKCLKTKSNIAYHVYSKNFFEGYGILGITYLICYGCFTFQNNHQFMFTSIFVTDFDSFFVFFLHFTFLLLQTCALRVAKSVEMIIFFNLHIVSIQSYLFPQSPRNEWQIWLPDFSAHVINLYIVG